MDPQISVNLIFWGPTFLTTQKMFKYRMKPRTLPSGDRLAMLQLPAASTQRWRFVWSTTCSMWLDIHHAGHYIYIYIYILLYVICYITIRCDSSYTFTWYHQYYCNIITETKLYLMSSSGHQPPPMGWGGTGRSVSYIYIYTVFWIYVLSASGDYINYGWCLHLNELIEVVMAVGFTLKNK